MTVIACEVEGLLLVVSEGTHLPQNAERAGPGAEQEVGGRIASQPSAFGTMPVHARVSRDRAAGRAPAPAA
jgi:hypothetical protein